MSDETATAPRTRRYQRKTGPNPSKATKKQAAEDANLLATAEQGAAQREAQRQAPPKPEPEVTRARPRQSFKDEEGKELTRRSLRSGSNNKFDIPEHLKKPGWDYQYMTLRVVGEPVDASDMVDWYEGGWRPVKANDMKELAPAGWDKPHIERGGQVLMCRPIHLTEEARQESIQIAEEQRFDKLQAALAGPQELGKVTKRAVDRMDFYGAVGNLSRR